MTSSSPKRSGSPFQDKLNTLLKYGPIKNVLDKVEDKTNCDRVIVLQILSLVACLVTVCGDSVGELVISLVGSLYPAYFSLHALATKDNEEQRRWLEYWLLSCVLHFFDLIFGGVLSSILPLYWLSQLVVVLWCIAPVDNNGSRVLYTTCVWPLYDRILKDVWPLYDRVLKKVGEAGVDGGEESTAKAPVESGDGSEDVGGESEENGDFVETSRDFVENVMSNVEDFVEASKDFAEDVRSKVEEANSNIVKDLTNFHDRMDKKID